MPFDVVAGVSQASSNSMRGLVDEKKLCVLENGIDWQKMDIERQKCPVRSSEAFTVSCVGRLFPAKGQRLLLQAFAQFNKNFSASKLLIAGDGPDETHLKQLAQQLGIMSCVRFLGHANTACVLARSDVFVHASESEGLSNAVLEAMVAGLPSVLVDAPGVTECHLNNITGFVVSRSVEALADKLQMLASDEALRRRMGGEARKRVCQYYSMEENCRRYELLYQELLEQS
jgi:glycosyltransferase involved in cell wall biosynthesis